MGLNDTVSAERPHIGFFGLRNAGKSSVVNAVTGQKLSLVSDIKGTTTDPVKKAMELLPIGPVVIIDTPGIDDSGVLGEMRVKRTMQVLEQTDIALLIIDGQKGLSPADRHLIELFEQKNITYIKVFNKSDKLDKIPAAGQNEIYVCATSGEGIYDLKEMIGRAAKIAKTERPLISDLIGPEDVAVLVVPIDSAAPKGRLILPQQQTIRAILDAGAIAVVTREKELEATLSSLKDKPKIVITDSQAFEQVDKITPRDITLTSFSILFARYKGDLKEAVKGAAALDSLNDGSRVLISEGCTHHRQCDDIGTVKMPKWVEKYTGKKLSFEFTSGGEFPDDPTGFDLVIHCGGCMLGEREMKSRIRRCVEKNVPITNYGIAIAQMHGILGRSVEAFPDIAEILK